MPRKTNDSSKSKTSATKMAEPKVEKVNATKRTSASKTRTKTSTKKSKTTDTKKTEKPNKATKKVSATVKEKSSKVAKTTKATTGSKTTKSTKTTKTTRAKKPKIDTLEYYDLPYRYNKTIVKILAQTPNTLFVYWDIADKDRKNFVKQFGDNFFDTTIPVLIVHNKTMNYSFQIEINDFANSWYFNINDANCDYEIELGRIAKPNTISLPNNYMYIASSNDIETPNDHILFEKEQKAVFFRNVKNGNRYSKSIAQFNFMRYMGRIYNIYDIYKKIYKLENLEELENPSSSFNKGAF